MNIITKLFRKIFKIDRRHYNTISDETRAMGQEAIQLKAKLRALRSKWEAQQELNELESEIEDSHEEDNNSDMEAKFMELVMNILTQKQGSLGSNIPVYGDFPNPQKKEGPNETK